MNNVFLLISLISLLVLILYVNRRSYFCASFFLAIVFTISTAFICFSPTYQGFELSEKTIIVLPLLIFMFFIGESSSWFYFHNKRYCAKQFDFRRIKVSNKVYYFSLILIVVISFVNFYYYFYKVAKAYGASDFFSSYIIIRGLTTQMADGDIIEPMMLRPKLLIYITNFARLMAYLFLFIYVYMRLIFNNTCHKYIYPIIAYIPTLAAATGRAAYFPLLLFFVSIILLLVKIRDGWFKRMARYEKKIALSFAIFLLFFLLIGAGNYRQQSNDNVSNDFILNTLSIYIGSPIAGFDYFLNNRNENMSLYPGHMTFEGVYKFLNLLGADFQNNPRNLDRFYINGESSNVYSGMYYIVSDYGILGSILFLALMGYIHGVIFMRFKYGLFSVENFLHIYIYTSMFTSLVMMFFNYSYYTYFSTGFIVELLYLLFIQRTILKYEQL